MSLELRPGARDWGAPLLISLLLTSAACVAAPPPASPSPSPPAVASQVRAPSPGGLPAAVPSSVVTAIVPQAPASSPVGSPAAGNALSPRADEASSCVNAFFPVSASARWRYRLTGGAPSVLIETHEPAGPDTFVVRGVLPEATGEQTWQCSGDGLVATQIPRTSTGQSPLRFTAERVRGVTLPRTDRWAVGASWTTEYDVRAAGEGGASGFVTITNTIDASEMRTVPAGEYETMRISQHILMDVRIETRGMTLPMTMTFASSQWYARDVGMIRSVSAGELGDTALELEAYAP